jgi:putative hydrolase
VSDLPFGFNLPGRGGGFNLPEGFNLPGGGSDLGAMFIQIGRLLSWQGGPINWDLAMQVARQAAAEGGDPAPGRAEQQAVADALRLAELWLDEATVLPAATSSTSAWSRAEWLEGTLAGWKPLVEPVAERIVDTVGRTVASQLPTEMTAMAGQLTSMMRTLGGALFGAQVGQALGALAREVTSSTDVGLPLGPARRGVLVPSGVSAFGAGLDLPDADVRLYVALREAAHHRLFAHAPWLTSRIVAAVEAYARGIQVDVPRLQDTITGLDPTDLGSVQRALSEGLLEPEDTPEQRAALTRLEALLALVEGWVDEVVHAAAVDHLPTAEALRETMRRRRATGGPAEEAFTALVGLQLRPRRLRDAARLWQALAATGGSASRDRVWDHPDLLPDAEDLDDPSGYARRLADTAGEQLDLSALAGLGEGEEGTEGGEGTKGADGDQNGGGAAGGTPPDQGGEEPTS